MAVNLGETGINPGDPKYSKLLANLQGGILKSHGRNHAILQFLRFKPGQAAAAAQFIRTFAAGVTTTRDQLAEAPAYDQNRTNGGLFANFFLTGAGYRYFGFPKGRMDERFEEGMRAWAEYLDDKPRTWERVYKAKEPIHAMILLADDERARLRTKEKAVALAASVVAQVLMRQPGITLRRNGDPHGEAIEHFGFVDGVSQPLFLKDDIEEVVGKDKYDPSAPLSLVLVPDPYAQAPGSYGSYLAFRKLQQDVPGFRKQKRRLIKALGLKGVHQDRAGAMIMGRFDDGTPLVAADRRGGHTLANPAPNNFDYAADRDAMKCPFHAHVRKMNSRLKAGRPDQDERSHRIARRAISYGTRGAKNVGLLFMCFQSDIEHQFEWLQRMVANDRNYFDTGTGLDPLIGLGPSAPQKWPVQWDQARTKPLDIHALVKVKGGEYFFAPSVGFLKVFPGPAR
jgi:Dyp-type peroxidase family